MKTHPLVEFFAYTFNGIQNLPPRIRYPLIETFVTALTPDLRITSEPLEKQIKRYRWRVGKRADDWTTARHETDFWLREINEQTVNKLIRLRNFDRLIRAAVDYHMRKEDYQGDEPFSFLIQNCCEAFDIAFPSEITRREVAKTDRYNFDLARVAVAMLCLAPSAKTPEVEERLGVFYRSGKRFFFESV